METEEENRNSVHLCWNGTDEAWNAYGKSAENTMHINPELCTLMDKAEPDGTQVTHPKATTEQFEEHGLTDRYAVVDDKRPKLKLKS